MQKFTVNVNGSSEDQGQDGQPWLLQKWNFIGDDSVLYLFHRSIEMGYGLAVLLQFWLTKKEVNLANCTANNKILIAVVGVGIYDAAISMTHGEDVHFELQVFWRKQQSLSSRSTLDQKAELIHKWFGKWESEARNQHITMWWAWAIC